VRNQIGDIQFSGGPEIPLNLSLPNQVDGVHSSTAKLSMISSEMCSLYGDINNITVVFANMNRPLRQKSKKYNQILPKTALSRNW
jgi:hypothetical protein